jgi:glyoxalase family protein
MSLDGLHHVTAITADAAGMLGFFVRRLRLRLVKKRVNSGAPDMHHLHLDDQTRPRGGPGR